MKASLFVFLIIAISVLTPPAHGEDMSNQQSCGSSAIVAMLKEIEALNQQLKSGKSSRPIMNYVGPPYVEVADIARKYIHNDCESTQLRIDLINAGFKIEDSSGVEPPIFSATIFLKRGWWQLGSDKLRLNVEYELGRIYVTGTIFYLSF